MSTVHVGVISDTHGLLRPEALAALQGVSLILHAGDIGSGDVIPALEAIAPVQAVRGNVDHGAWVRAHPFTRVVEAGGAWLYMLHDLAAIELDPAPAGFAAVISGHSHQPKVELRGGVLYLNPGSAGPRRYNLPVCVAHLEVTGGKVTARLIPLPI